MDYQVIEKLLPHVDLGGIGSNRTIFRPNRYHIMHGGRGGGKSVFVEKTLALEGYLQPRRILCTREIQNSISESVMAGLWDAICELGLDGFYRKTKTEIVGDNGTVFLFTGLRSNITKVKSISGIDFVWAEEAEAITADSWTTLLPSIRHPGARIIITFNPRSLMDDTYQRFVINPPTDAVVTKINWDDNPFFPASLNQERLDMLDSEPDLYRHVWEGEPLADSNLAIVPPSWARAAVDIHEYLSMDISGGKTVGFDVSDEGDDPNANAMSHGMVITELKEWRDTDPNSAAAQTWDNCLEFDGDRIVFDSIGVGAGAKGELRQAVERHEMSGKRPPDVKGFDAGGAVENPLAMYNGAKPNKEMFANLKAQRWWELRDACQQAFLARQGKDFDQSKLISFNSKTIEPKLLEKCLAEMSTPRREYLGGKVKVESKDKLKTRGIKSHNLADAVIMARYQPSGINPALQMMLQGG